MNAIRNGIWAENNMYSDGCPLSLTHTSDGGDNKNLMRFGTNYSLLEWAPFQILLCLLESNQEVTNGFTFANKIEISTKCIQTASLIVYITV